MAIITPDHLGTDKAGRGAGWDKTNATLVVATALADCKQRNNMSGGQLFGALVENVIAAIQGSVAPHAWREAASSVTDLIQRRMRP